ncbi:MAG TPA: hypothetical protein VGE64_04085 [Xanthomonadaceae bacterium]
MLRGEYSLLVLIAAMFMRVSVAQAATCPDMKAMSLSAFMGGELPANTPLQVHVPVAYSRTDLSGIHPARSIWLTLENAAVAKRGGGLDDFMYGTPADGVEFDADRLSFFDAQGRHLQGAMESIEDGKVDLVRTGKHTILFTAAKPDAADRRFYVAYIALQTEPRVLRVGYRPPAGDPAMGECVWQSFKTALIGDGVGVAVYTPTTKSVADAVIAHVDWAEDAGRCPVDLLGNTPQAVIGDDACIWTDGSACLKRCESGDANACYGLGRDLLVREQPQSAGMLLSRACRLGVVPACTNRAIEQFGRDQQSAVTQRCAYLSVEKTCTLGDAWGCAMQGSFLRKGNGVARDLDKARAVLEKACGDAPETDACASARRTLRKIDEQ